MRKVGPIGLSHRDSLVDLNAAPVTGDHHQSEQTRRQKRQGRRFRNLNLAVNRSQIQRKIGADDSVDRALKCETGCRDVADIEADKARGAGCEHNAIQKARQVLLLEIGKYRLECVGEPGTPERPIDDRDAVRADIVGIAAEQMRELCPRQKRIFVLKQRTVVAGEGVKKLRGYRSP